MGKGNLERPLEHAGTPLVDSGDVADHPYQPQFQAFVDSLRKGEAMP
ncbi:MAG: hypothetical protein ACR2L2_04320 [Acidobacteriota bacterium]